MDNFTYHNPVRIHFGKGQIAKLGEELPSDRPIVLLYGGGSIKRNGVYEQVMAACGDRQVVEFGGIEPNPTYETCMKAVQAIGDLKKGDQVFLLAVGGGSVLDATKFIAAAALFEGGDPWDILVAGASIERALPLGTVLTLPATGSEMNFFSVISRTSTRQKRAFGHPKVYPVFSILDPTTTFSLPRHQVANGIADAFTHVLEQYLTYPTRSQVQDRWAEALLMTLVEEGPKTLADAQDYDSRANFMWAATMAVNGLIGAGVPQDWATHMIGHELTALYGIDHGRTLAVVMPALMTVRKQAKLDKLLQYGRRVWQIAESAGSPEQRADLAIDMTRRFYESLDIPTRLSRYEQVRQPEQAPDLVAERLEKQGMTALGERGEVTPPVARQIVQMCL